MFNFEEDTFDYDNNLQLAISAYGDISLWCEIISVESDIINAYVLNGFYDIKIDRKTNTTMAPFEGGKVCWVGDAQDADYNEVLAWLRREINV